MNCRITLIATTAAAIVLAAGCRSSKPEPSMQIIDAPVAPVMRSEPRVIPRGHVYRTNGDYNNFVPVTLDQSLTKLISFPAPTDITAASAPVALGDGYLLDRRGVGPTSAFTRWTYAEYAALPQAPTISEIMENLIPSARVTEILELPLTLSEAAADPARCAELLKEGDYKVIFVTPSR
ncbi:MAG: hypothetical protein NC336_05885 [Clostridium sp.]|nr:hypothetical protein [Clostridium sp.]